MCLLIDDFYGTYLLFTTEKPVDIKADILQYNIILNNLKKITTSKITLTSYIKWRR